MFVPTKYTVDNTNCTLTVSCRDENGIRKLFKYEIVPKILFEVSGSIGSIGDILEILKNTLNTNNVYYDENMNRFISYGKLEIPKEINHYFKSITCIPLKTSTALQNLNRKFFDKIKEDGSLTNEPAKIITYKHIVWDIQVEIPSISSDSSFDKNCITTINFVTSDKDTPITWTILSSMEGAITYDNEKIMLESFYNFLIEYDVSVTFNKDISNYFISRLNNLKHVKIKKEYNDYGYIEYKEFDIVTLEHICLSDLTKLLYTNICDQSFVSLSKNLLNKNVIEFNYEEIRILISAELNKTTNKDQKKRLKDIRGYMVNNINILNDLFIHFAPIINNLSNSSGCNFSELNDLNIYKDIIGYFNPSMVNNPILSILPKKYMKRGIYTNVYTISLGSYLQNNLISSPDKLTREIGFSISNLVNHDWIIEKIFQLEGLDRSDISGFFSQPSEIGIYNGLLYTLEHNSESKILKKWDMFIVIGTGNWIGVNRMDDSKFIYTYNGIADICKHPFKAVKLCIELYLSFLIDNVSINIYQVVKNTNLIHETMVMKRYATLQNIETYKDVLSKEQINALTNKECKYIPLNVYYGNNKTLTINPYESDIEVYRSELTRIMKTLPDM